jgi:hypothetical protein
MLRMCKELTGNALVNGSLHAAEDPRLLLMVAAPKATGNGCRASRLVLYDASARLEISSGETSSW